MQAEKIFKASTLAMAIIGATGAATPVLAQESLGFLEEVVVTASPRAVTKFESTVSINTVSDEQISQMSPRSAAEILRTIPGVRSESSAGEGNTNISVRGVPVAAGGSKFVQIQEDGMPIMLFGDIIVGTSDQFLRVDNTVRRVEVLKGSAAATMASNSPGGVINFISKTGEEEGGSVAVSTGLDYDSFRTDFEYGAPLSDGWRFHIGGFYREGEGVRDVDFNASKGSQIKFNITKEFDEGYLRFYAKHLDDTVPTYLPMPMTASGDSIPGFDAGSSSNISSDLQNIVSVGATGNGRISGADEGNTSKSDAFGIDFEIEVSEGLILVERMRYSQNSGTFFGAFTADIGSASDVGSLSGALAGTGANGLAYVSGADAGVLLTSSEMADLNGNGLLQNIRTFDNDLENLDNFTNDIKLIKSFESVELTLGYYKSTQQIDVNWYWQTFVQDVSDNARLLNVYADGTQLTENGQLAYGAPDWGNCCTRDTSLEADTDAFYVAAHFDVSDALTIDASIRYDDGEATGHYAFGNTVAYDVNGDGTSVGQLAEQSVTFIDYAGINSSRFKYDWNYVSYSVAANYIVNDSIALFGSVSSGSRVNADRLGDGGYLVDGTAADGSVENELTSFEFGTKYDGENIGVFATLFYVETDDVNSEPTNANGSARVREYESLGLELEALAQWGEFSLRSSLTWTDSEIVASNVTDLIGNTPRRQADVVWSLSPSYQLGNHVVGATIISTGDSYDQDDNSFEIDGYTYANVFVDFRLAENLNAMFSVNNITDEIGITEKEGGSSFVNGQEYIRARSISGRTAAVSLKYQF